MSVSVKSLKNTFISIKNFSDEDLGRDCEVEAGHVLNECYKGCHDDQYCITKCVRDYDYHTYHCPCDGGCPHGCPCPVYVCPGYTTSIWVDYFTPLDFEIIFTLQKT